MEAAIAALKRDGLAVLLCEPNLHFAGRLADRAVILEKGQVRYTGTMAALMADATTRKTYLEL
jgi:branched-chain amino acid transport system ATP-binding protein